METTRRLSIKEEGGKRGEAKGFRSVRQNNNCKKSEGKAGKGAAAKRRRHNAPNGAKCRQKKTVKSTRSIKSNMYAKTTTKSKRKEKEKKKQLKYEI